jgi:hypothetical protein
MKSRLVSRALVAAIFLAMLSTIAQAQTPPPAPGNNCSLNDRGDERPDWTPQSSLKHYDRAQRSKLQ